MVFLFHFFARWTPPEYPKNMYPYESEILTNISKFGYFGVQLFFIISGFVIHKSLEKNNSIQTFYFARVNRIFPSLWISLPIILIFCNLINRPPISPIPKSSLLPSLTLMNPDLLNQLFPTEFVWTSGVLWSLLIEFQFYLIAGVIFFKLRNFDFNSKIVFFAILIFSLDKLLNIYWPQNMNIFESILPLNSYIWWFLAGSALYSLRICQKKLLNSFFFISSLILNELYINVEFSSIRFELIPSLLCVMIYAIAYLTIVQHMNFHFLNSSVMVIFGGISYEFYLIHQSLGISAVSVWREIGTGINNQVVKLIMFLILFIFLVALSSVIKMTAGILSKRIQKIYQYKSNFPKPTLK